jgi:hypothetical protein
MLPTDVHQHLWPEELVNALTWRREPPLLRRHDGGWILRLRDDPDYPFDPRDHDPERRLALLERDGVRRALLAISSPLGIEGLTRPDAEPLLAAHNDALLELAGRSASGAPYRCAHPTRPTSTHCSTPARSASRCPRARSAGPTGCGAAASCSRASNSTTRRCSSTPAPTRGGHGGRRPMPTTASPVGGPR